jgi:hypothetical protein
LSIAIQIHTDKPNAILIVDLFFRMYILFVLTFYAFSIVVLMVKYIKREREGSKLEFYYNEFVKREWYKDKNLYDNKGRRIQYNEDGCKVKNMENLSKPEGRLRIGPLGKLGRFKSFSTLFTERVSQS